jgi:hypothetical protein
MENENSDLYFSQVLNVHRVNGVMQVEVHAVELLVPDPSPFEVAITKLEKYVTR